MARARDTLAGLIWTAPWWLGFLFFLAIPMTVSLYISFCDYPLLQPPVWTGSANYAALATDPTFHRVVWNTLLFAALSIPICTIVGIGLATLLNQPVKGQAAFRAAVFLPTIVPLVAVGVIWMWLLNPEYGLMNQGLRGPLSVFGWGTPKWLESPWGSRAALVLISLWLVGSPMVIYLAGLQEIPEELYEAARLDGANGPRRFWHVTLPNLSPVILFNVITAIIGTWQIFALPYVIWRTREGPDRAVYFYTTYLYDNAFRYLKMGYASAMAWIQLLIILALTGLVFWASKRTVHYRGQ